MADEKRLARWTRQLEALAADMLDEHPASKLENLVRYALDEARHLVSVTTWPEAFEVTYGDDPANPHPVGEAERSLSLSVGEVQNNEVDGPSASGSVV